MLPNEYPQQHFVFAGTREVREDEKQVQRDILSVLPRRIWRAALLLLVVWPLCFVALVGLYRLLDHSDNSLLQILLIVPVIAGVFAVPTVALTLLSKIRNEWLVAKARLKVEQVEHWAPCPEAQQDEEDEETWGLPVWVEVITNTTTIWDEECDDYEDMGDEYDEEQDNGAPRGAARVPPGMVKMARNFWALRAS